MIILLCFKNVLYAKCGNLSQITFPLEKVRYVGTVDLRNLYDVIHDTVT